MKLFIAFLSLSISFSFPTLCMDSVEKTSEDNNNSPLGFFPTIENNAPDNDRNSSSEGDFGVVGSLFSDDEDNNPFGFVASSESETLSLRDTSLLSRNIPIEHGRDFGFSETRIPRPIPAVPLYEILECIKGVEFKPLAFATGFGKIYLSDTKVIKLCSNTHEASVVEELYKNHFPYVPTIESIEKFRTALNISGFNTMAVLCMKRGAETFGEFIKTHTIAENLTTFIQVCEAVKALHSLNYMHGDLKPANILVDNGHILLIDFDQTKEFGDATGAGTPNYTNAYVSLSNSDGFIEEGSVSACSRIDIFSLGLILYEIFYNDIFFSKPAMSDFELIERKKAIARNDDNTQLVIKFRLTNEELGLENFVIHQALTTSKIDDLIESAKKLLAHYSKASIPFID